MPAPQPDPANPILNPPIPHLERELDLELPRLVAIDLEEFAQIYRELAAGADLSPEEFGPHTVAALTGTYTQNGEPQRMKIVLPNDVQAHELEQHCDVDSVIGFVYEGDPFPLPDDVCLQYQPLNNTDFTLEHSLHLPTFKVPGRHATLMETYTEYHKVPNAVLGTIGGHNIFKIMVRVFFPGIMRERQAAAGNKVSKEVMCALYDQVVRPSIEEVLPRELLSNWPLEWTDEQFRSTKDSGQTVFTSYQVPGEYLDDMLAMMHVKARENPASKMFRDFFLQVQIQGSKLGTKHHVEHPDIEGSQERFMDARLASLVKAVQLLDVHSMKYENWWADIATVVRHRDPTKSLLPRKDRHNWMIHTATGIDAADAGSRVDRGVGAGYASDETAHLGSVAGLRLTMKKNLAPSPCGVEYLQVYTTDKTLTSLKDGDYHAKHCEPQQVFKNYPKEAVEHFERLLNILRNAESKDQAVDVRIECRVNMANATDVLRWVPEDHLANSLVCSGTAPYWRWKLINTQAAMATMNLAWYQLPKLPVARILAPATLIIGLCWKVNAMLNRPREDHKFGKLAKQLSVWEMRNGNTVAARPQNAAFLHSLKADPCPRVSHLRCLDLKEVASLSGIHEGAPEGEIRQLILRGKGTIRRLEAAASWGPVGDELNKTNGPSKRSGEEEEQEMELITSRAKRIRMNVPDGPRVVEAGAEGVPEAATASGYESEGEEAQRAGTSNHDWIDSIIRRMAGELIMKVPTVSKLACRVPSEHACKKLTFDVLKDTKQLPRLLHRWRQLDDCNKWEDSVRRLFPSEAEYRQKRTAKDGSLKTTFTQGLQVMSFYQDWTSELCSDRLSATQKEEMVTFARRILTEQAAWLPVGSSDRVWASKGGSSTAKVHGSNNHPSKGVIVVFNPDKGGDVDIPGGYE
ncbi:hypothetical protein FRC08_006483 [Ceratobasidium sp. 394]|nr:hypothetical protein FRC08_006483 [Ceratobasidium sp. 394]